MLDAPAPKPEPPPVETNAPSVPEPQTVFRVRTMLLALVFGTLGILWVIQNGLVGQSVYIGGSVPPIPTVTVLLLLAAIHPRLRRWGLSQGEILLIALFVGVATAIADPNCLLTYWIAFLMVARYAPSEAGQFGGLTQSLPATAVPGDAQALMGFAEGHAPVAWGVWLIPITGWSLFFLAFWGMSLAVLRLFRDRWITHERLQFPIVDLMLHLTPPETSARSYLRNRLFWGGIGISTALNLLNIANAFDPGIPAPGRFVDVGPIFTQLPWQALSPCWISLRPEIFGIGYLMSTEVLFTTWFSYVALRFSSVAGSAMGYEVYSGYYDYQEIASGAYLGILFMLVWMGRGSARVVLAQAKESLRRLPATDPRAAANRCNRFCAGIALAGFVYQVGWAMHLGMAWWIGILYIGLLLAFAVVYARIRAETGAPIWYLFPFWQQQKLLVNVFGSSALGMDGGASLTALAVMGFLARGTYPSLAAFHIEAMEMGHRARIHPRSIFTCLLTALPFGLGLGVVLFLLHCYRFGFYSLDGSMGAGGFRVMMATQQYRELTQWKSAPTGPNLPLIIHTFLGGGIALGMARMRSVFMGWPLHPLGFAMASSYGFHLWAPFLAVWVCKLLILRAGGMRLFRQLIPLFLGIVVGHYLTVGIVWGLISIFVPELTRKYIVHFA
jgi:hypothetical protein